MTRIKYWDYKQEDLTLYLNEWRRGVLQPGVYFGFNASPGTSGGLNVDLDMDADPDKSGSYLGTLITRDGVTVQETEDLADVDACTAAHPTLPRIDLLVCTYVYNASEPANDVTYEIIEGTAASNPSVPSYSENQLPIAQIYVAAAQTTLTADDIVDVNRLSLYGAGILDSIEDILRPGFYTGFLCKEGSTDDDTTVEAGSFITQELKRLNQASSQTDLFTHSTCTSSDHYRYDWIVAMHKSEGIENNAADIDYILVEGSEADESAGAVATPPSNSAILTAAQAVDGKYTSVNYINKICLVRVQGTTGSMVKDYIHTPRLLQDTHWYVSGGSLTSGTESLGPLMQFFPYQGPQGLVLALDALQALVSSFYGSLEAVEFDESPIKLWIDGNFKLTPDELLGVPSFVEICGMGGAEITAPSASHAVISFGHTCNDDAPATTISASVAADQTGLPGGYERWDVDFDSSAGGLLSYYFLSDELTRARFAGGASAGDPIYIDDNGTFREGWFEDYSGGSGDEFTAVFPTATTGPFNKIVMFKQRAGLKDISIKVKSPAVSSANYLSIMGCRDCKFDNVVAPAIETSANNERTVVRDLRLTQGAGHWVTRDSTDSPLPSIGLNRYDNVLIKPIVAGTALVYPGVHPSLASSDRPETKAHVTNFSVDLESDPTGAVTSAWRDSVISCLEQLGGDNPLTVSGDACVIQSLIASDPKSTGSNDQIAVSGSNNMLGSAIVRDVDPAQFQWGSSAVDNTLGSFVGTNAEIVFASTAARRNYLVSSGLVADSVSSDELSGGLVQSDEDRNVALVSTATFTWSSGTLTFDDDIILDLPYSAGRMIVQQSESPIAISDGERVFVHVNRGASGDENKTPAVVAKASSDARRNRDEFVIARRVGTILYFMDGSVLPDGSSGSLNNSIPLDGSVTHTKLAASAKAFITDCLNAHFAVNPNISADFIDADVIFETADLTGLGAWSITASTGVLACGGMSSTEWDQVVAGDTFIDAAGQRWPIVESTSSYWRLHPGSDPDLTISTPEDDLNVGRGAGIWKSSDSYSVTTLGTIPGRYSYRITMGSGTLPDHVSPGYLFIDSAGDRYVILSVTASSGIMDIAASTQPPAFAGGSVQLRVVADINPRGLNLMDLKQTYGCEVLPIHSAGARGYRDEEWPIYLSRYSSDLSDVYVSTSRNGPEERIVAYGDVATEAGHTTSPAIDGGKGIIIGGGEGGIMITAYMTGIAILASNNCGYNAVIDGQRVDTLFSPEQADLDSDLFDRRFWLTDHNLQHMTPGVHTVVIHSSNANIVGVAIINEPNPWKNALADSPYTQIGGRVYKDMGAWDHVKGDVNLPSLSDRGGRLVRYIPDSDPTTQSWAEQSLAPVVDTGSTSSASPTITSVANPDYFKVGDIVRLVYAADAEKRVVTAVGATSIDVGPTDPSNTESGVSIEFVGRTFLSVLEDAEHDFRHPNESMIAEIPFYAIDNNGPQASGEYMYSVAGNKTGILSDTMQYVFLGTCNFDTYGRSLELTASSSVFIAFVGTGLDLIFAEGSTTATYSDLTLDGVNLGTGEFFSVPGAGDPVIDAGINDIFTLPEDNYAIPIVQDLDYGYHVVEFNLDDNAFLHGYRVWGPALPSFEGTPLWESFYVGERALSSGSTAILDDGDFAPSGFLQVEPGQFFYGDEDNVSNDIVYGKRILSVDDIPNVSTTTQRLFAAFYGTGFGMEIDPVGSGMDMAVEVLDRDGTWVDINSLDCATVVGDSTPVVNIPTTSPRYFWEFYEPVGYGSTPVPLEKLWFVRITLDNDPSGTTFNDIDFDKAWVRHRLHSWQREDTYGRKYNGWLVPRSSGRDCRVLKAYDSVQSTPPMSYGVVNLHTLFRSNPFTVPPIRGQLLKILSGGEWWDISAVLVLTENIVGIGLDLIHVNKRATQASTSNTHIIARYTMPDDSGAANAPAGGNQVVLRGQLYLPPGWHAFAVNAVDQSDNSEYGSDVEMSHYSFSAVPVAQAGTNLQPVRATIPLQLTSKRSVI